MAELQGDLKKLQVLFWTQLLERARERGVLHHNKCKPAKRSFLSTGAGRAGLSFEYQIFVTDNAAVQLYFSHKDPIINQNRYKCLYSSKGAIEEKLGMPLEFNPDPIQAETNCCSVQGYLPGRGLRDAGDQWPELQEQMIDTMDSFVQVLRPYIEDMPIR